MKRFGTVLIALLLALLMAAPAMARVEDEILILRTTEIKAAGADSDVDYTGAHDFSSATLTLPGSRDIHFDLAGAGVDGGDDVDDGSTPDIGSEDGVPTIVWANSGETTAVQWTFRVPSDYSTGMVFYALVSSDDASGSGTILDWALTANGNDASFGSATAQTGVECTSATLDASCEVLTLTVDATGLALFTSGAWITIELFNASTNDDDLELKGLHGTYTPLY